MSNSYLDSITRCKDCKHFVVDPFHRTVCARLTVQFPMNKDDFCSYGEEQADDCSYSANYIREKERMCRYQARYKCVDCPLDKINNGTGDECYVFCVTYLERAVEAVQRWVNNHDGKDIIDD